MGKVLVRQLYSCAGKCPNSSAIGSSAASEHPQVSDEEAMEGDYIPAEGISAALISSQRILITGGVLQDERVLPFTVLRYLDLDRQPRWSKPHLLRNRRRRHDVAFPICRLDHTLTYAPAVSKMYLIGGLKVSPKDGGQPCKTMFSFDPTQKVWEPIGPPEGIVKPDPDQTLGRRFAHVTCFIHKLVDKNGTSSRSRSKSNGFLFVHGGYSSTDDTAPKSDVHLFDIKQKRWAHKNPIHSCDPPKRAYHAAATIESEKYVVIHGGTCSDFYDSLLMSKDLFVYDLQLDRWSIPQLHPSSHTPPTARTRHTLVAGVGQQFGKLVMYGGYLSSGEYCNELYVLRIIEPQNQGSQIEAVWEKVDIQFITSKSLLANNANDIINSPQDEDVHRIENTKVAGACLVPVPKLRKYVLLGGRGKHGIRTTPLLLDADEKDDINFVESPEDQITHCSNLLEIRKRRKDEKRIVVPTNLQSNAPVSNREQTEECKYDITKEKTSLKRRRPPNTNVDVPLDRDASQLLSVPLSLSEKSPSPDIRADLVNDTSLDVSDKPTLKDKLSVCKTESVSQPNTNRSGLVSPSSLNNGFVSLASTEGKSEAHPSKNEIEVSHKRISRSDESPPPKRARTKERKEESDHKNLVGENMDRTVSPTRNAKNKNIDSSQSDFLTPTELARKSRAQSTKSRRGRGRGRGRPTRSRKNDTIAENDEMLRKQGETLCQLEENAKLIGKLKTENSKLKSQNQTINKDNQELNDRMTSLLDEVKTLRNSKNRDNRNIIHTDTNVRVLHLLDDSPNSVADTPPSISNGKELRNDPGRISDSPAEPNKALVTLLESKSSSKICRSTEVKALRSQAANLQEECTEAKLEKENLDQSLRELELEKRSIQKELCVTKNQLERISLEHNILKRQAEDSYRVSMAANNVAEEAQKQIRRIEEHNTILRLNFEGANKSLKEERRENEKVNLELKGKEHIISTLRAKISEIEKKNTANDSGHLRLTEDLESERTKHLEVQSLLDETIVEKQQLEEKIVDLVAERESLQAELDNKLKECTAALVDNDRSRDALDKGKKEVEAASLEQIRLKKQFEAIQMENERLKKLQTEQENGLKSLMRTFLHLKNDFESQLKIPLTHNCSLNLTGTNINNEQDEQANVEVNKNVAGTQNNCKSGSESTADRTITNVTIKQNRNKASGSSRGATSSPDPQRSIAANAAIPDSDDSDKR